MSVFVRPAAVGDLRQMAEISGVNVPDLGGWMDDGAAYAAWHLAEDAAGTLLGFQRIGARADLPANTCEIASFFRTTSLPAGTSARLFDATAETARLLGYAWVHADFSASNEGARIHYQSLGFRVAHNAAQRIVMHYDLE